jgi:hypothetical protein
MELLRNRHFVITRASGSPLIELKRTAEPFESIDEMRLGFTEVNSVLDHAGRISANLLIDTRDAPPRNDPAFEIVFEPLRIAMLGGFRRVAVLVRTTAGRLQAERHVRTDGTEGGRVFTEEAEARAFCSRTR